MDVQDRLARDNYWWGLEPGLRPPDVPHADDDEFQAVNGTDPTTRGWSWAHQTSVTATIKGGKLVMDGTPSTVRGYHQLVKTFPGSGDVSISSRVALHAANNNWAMGILFMWGTIATPTRLEIVYLIQEASAGRAVFWTAGSNYTTGIANRGNLAAGFFDLPYLRITYTSGSDAWRCFYSASPSAVADWVPIAAAQSGLGRPAYYGVSLTDLTNNPSGSVLQGHVDFFRVNWAGSDYNPA